MAELLDAIEQRARTDADAVMPVLELLAQPDEDADDPDGVIHQAAQRLNRTRLDAAEQRFRAGSLTTAQVRERLSVSRQAVAERVRTGGLLAAKVGSRLAYPDWQFSSSGLVRGLPAVLGALAEVSAKRPAGQGTEREVDVRAADAVMRAGQPGLPDRMSLADLLALGEVTEVVQRLTVRADQS